jgi:hypothetical protein
VDYIGPLVMLGLFSVLVGVLRADHSNYSLLPTKHKERPHHVA